MNRNDICQLEHDLNLAHSQFLRERGWTFSSNWPGSICFWTRTLPDGRVVGLSVESAINTEEGTA